MPTIPAPTVQGGHVPAPAGVNLVDSASALPLEDCLALTNMVRAEHGLRSRLGYREHVTQIGSQVRSLLGFQGAKDDGSEDRLFACATDGIYNCTASTSAPTRVHTFATSNTQSGRGVARGFTTIAGGHYLLYCDEANGYLTYNGATAAWAAGVVTGVNPGALVSVAVWKHRVWFVQKDSADAWYLATDMIGGAASRFPFGPHFRHGGTLVGLWSWTADGGAGVDDYLVALSSSGDVVIFQGTDPSDAAKIAIRGVWYVGPPPVGRRLATDHGGDLLILSTLGAIPLSRLTAGAEVARRDAYETYKVAPVLGRLLTERRQRYGWEIRIHPEDKTLLITVPAASGIQATEQFSMSLAARGWSRHTGVPMTCTEVWRDKLYFGTDTGTVCINTGTVDDQRLSSPGGAVAISFAGLSRYDNLGTGAQKRAQMVRPLFLTDGVTPLYEIEARTNFNVADPGGFSYATQPDSGSWGSGLWGAMSWGASQGTAGDYRGVCGLGSHLAIVWRGASKGMVTLIGFDVLFDQGGPL